MAIELVSLGFGVGANANHLSLFDASLLQQAASAVAHVASSQPAEGDEARQRQRPQLLKTDSWKMLDPGYGYFNIVDGKLAAEEADWEMYDACSSNGRRSGSGELGKGARKRASLPDFVLMFTAFGT